MDLVFLDTNLIIRYLTRDNPERAQRAKHILDQVAAGTLAVTTTAAIIAEVVYVLSSKVLYNLPRPEIRMHLTTILSLKGFRLPHI